MQHKNRAVGPDEIAVEAYKFGMPYLYEYLTTLLNLCLTHCYLHSALMHSVFGPLVKISNGNLCDIYNYMGLLSSPTFKLKCLNL